MAIAVLNRPAAAGRIHFKGLNSLRFFAALFVVIGHIPLNQESVGLPHPAAAAFFYRGAPAVSFFFTLSGFLITYLLLEEWRRTGSISVKSFYLRRMCRIWPLYFAVVAFGLLFYNALLPWLGIPYRIEYHLGLAALLYTFFLPNLMNSLYTVGGILNPTWSIGVEEQFYLFWAPLVKRLHGRLAALCWVVLGVSLALFCLNHFDVFGAFWSKKLVGQLKFHFMAAGGLCAWWLHSRREAFLDLKPFSSRVVQLVLFALLLDFYLLSSIPWGWLGEEILQMLLYAWLIVTVAVNPRNVIPVETRAWDYLGTISYGIYMLHMIAVYTTSALFSRLHGGEWNLGLYCLGYYGLALGITILLAHVSYRWLELPFLRHKERSLSLPSPQLLQPPESPPPLATPAVAAADNPD